MQKRLSATVFRACFPRVACNIDSLMRLWVVDLLKFLLHKGVIKESLDVSTEVSTVPPARLWRRLSWWLPGAADGTCKVHEAHVDIAALGGSRRRVRCRRACAVCARFDWEHEDVYMWERAGGKNGPSVFRDGQPIRCADVEKVQAVMADVDATWDKRGSDFSARDLAHTLFFHPRVTCVGGAFVATMD